MSAGWPRRSTSLLNNLPDFDQALGVENNRGHTLVSLISSGTELPYAFISTENIINNVGDVHVECVGHEAVVLEGCKLMRRKGERERECVCLLPFRL
jgi:hypothetical protein